MTEEARDALSRIIAGYVSNGDFGGMTEEEIVEYIRGNIDAVISLYGEA